MEKWDSVATVQLATLVEEEFAVALDLESAASFLKSSPIYGSNLRWPDGKRFAFSIFDDPDSQTLETSKAVYSLSSFLRR